MSSDEEDDEEDVAELAPPPKSALRQRSSVSAEAFGEWNKREAYVAPVHPKTPEQTQEITNMLGKSFLCSNLEAKDLAIVVAAMKGPIVCPPGHVLITEGDQGDCLYVIEDGVLDCAKIIDGENKVVKTCVKGDIFGELALLYNCPRKASVYSRDTSTVWQLDRHTFTNIVLQAVQLKRTQCNAVLRKVPLFQTMSDGEVENVIDALKLEKRVEGDVIIKQGDEGDYFYIVYEGEVVASKVVPENPEPTQFVHKGGDYFGELALLKNVPRAASVLARTPEVKLLSMDRATFKRLMGPVEEFLQRAAVRYE